MSFANRIPPARRPLPRPAAYLLAAAAISMALFASDVMPKVADV